MSCKIDFSKRALPDQPPQSIVSNAREIFGGEFSAPNKRQRTTREQKGQRLPQDLTVRGCKLKCVANGLVSANDLTETCRTADPDLFLLLLSLDIHSIPDGRHMSLCKGRLDLSIQKFTDGKTIDRRTRRGEKGGNRGESDVRIYVVSIASDLSRGVGA